MNRVLNFNIKIRYGVEKIKLCRKGLNIKLPEIEINRIEKNYMKDMLAFSDSYIFEVQNNLNLERQKYFEELLQNIT